MWINTTWHQWFQSHPMLTKRLILHIKLRHWRINSPLASAGGIYSFQCFALHGRATCAYPCTHVTYFHFHYPTQVWKVRDVFPWSVGFLWGRRWTLKFGREEKKDSDEGLTLYLTIDRSKRTVPRSGRQKENSTPFFLLCVSLCAIRKQHTCPCAVHVTSQKMSAFRLFRRSGIIGSRVCSVLPLSSCVFVIPACRVYEQFCLSYDTGSRVECLLLLRN